MSLFGSTPAKNNSIESKCSTPALEFASLKLKTPTPGTRFASIELKTPTPGTRLASIESKDPRSHLPGSPKILGHAWFPEGFLGNSWDSEEKLVWGRLKSQVSPRH